MAWIESHQSLLTHPKTIDAVSALRVDRYKFLGHLHALWWWALDVVDMDGNFPPHCSNEVLAIAAGWPVKAADGFVAALMAAGFIDEAAGERSLHDWYDYAGKLTMRRAVNKQRMKAARASHVSTTDATRVGLPTNQQKQTTETTQPTQENPVRLPVLRLLEQCFARPLAPMEIENANLLQDEHPYDRIEYAIREASELNKRSLRYIQRICEGQERNGDNHDAGRPQPNGSTYAPRGLTSEESAVLERLGVGKREFYMD